MTVAPSRVFLDTNCYIIGIADLNSYEYQILKWAGLEKKDSGSVEVVVSQELFEQILRVAKRLQNKDWGSQLLGRIWQNFNVCYAMLDDDEFSLSGVAWGDTA